MTRSIVIAGVSKAIGRAEAEALVAAGWDVIGIARHAPANFSGQFETTDLSDPEGTTESLLGATDRDGAGRNKEHRAEILSDSPCDVEEHKSFRRSMNAQMET